MTQESQHVETLDAEDQMAQAFAELRAARSDEQVEVVAEVPDEPKQEATPVEDTQPVAETKPDPDEQLRLKKEELHKLQSEIGRVGALNAKYMQATQELAQLRQQLAAKQEPEKQAETNAETADALSKVAEQVKDFPELAGIVAAVSDALKQADRKAEKVAREAAAQLVEPFEPLRREQTSRMESERKAAFDAALTTFNTTYPTAAEVVNSDQFNSWLRNQPGHIQFAFAKGQTPQEAMSVLDAYDMHLRRTGLPTIAQINQPQQQTAPADKPASAERLRRAAGIPSRSTGANGGQPPADDFEASLAYFRNKRLAAVRAAA